MTEIKQSVLAFVKQEMVQDFLVMERIKEFKDKLIPHIYVHSKKILGFDNCFIDYFRKKNKPIYSVVTCYLTNSNLDNIGNKKFVFRLLQFLSFSRGQLAY